MSEHDQNTSMHPQTDVNEAPASECCTHESSCQSMKAQDTQAVQHKLRTLRPEVDITEYEDRLELVVDLPGADRSTTDLVLEKNVLTITSTPQPLALDGYECLAREYQVGQFERMFVISDEIDRDGIDAEFRNGVLTVTLPKQATRLARKITIQNN